LLVLAACLPLGCASLFSESRPRSASAPASYDRDQQRAEQRAASERVERLEREVRRLHTDLKAAEEALIAAESGLIGNRTRADAVSALAEARIQVEQAAGAAPWRQDGLAQARSKLAEADRQIQDGHFGASIFFASRAERVADELIAEARQAAASPSTRWVSGRGVNMREGPTTRARVLSTLALRTPVFQEKVVGNWALVRTPAGEIGWVHRTLLAGR
jgi:hypothetical protein